MTLIFVILKISGGLIWSWWYVLMPLIIGTGIAIVFVLLLCLVVIFTNVFSAMM